MAEERNWLGELEHEVRAAAERIAALRREKEALARRVEELEVRLAAGAPGEDPAWPRARAEVRRRVESLASRLEELAAAAAAGDEPDPSGKTPD